MAVKIVVRMQHTPTTFQEIAIKPKKSADACLFCFTGTAPRSKLRPSLENGLQSIPGFPRAAGIGLNLYLWNIM
jgi:hypothetical protein